ncbi:hypothetical protein BDW74DRAFT_146674 [Aspergillus multicolor]|uniref:uncharacterized protein n=1 Tax=Aspergillus multicolor TaxID=41759 RepID=UPI003CCDC2C1
MRKASPGCLLGGASLFLTILVTVLDGVCYGSSQALTPDNSFIEAVIVSFSTISCSVVLALILILANDSKIDARVLREGWRVITYGTGIGYLIVAAGVTAGGITWSALQAVGEVKKSNTNPSRQALFIARCVLWAISVLSQGMLSGVLLTIITDIDSRNKWPTLISYELSTIATSRSDILQKGTPYAPSSIAESQCLSVDTITPHQSSVSREMSRRSIRYSGRTLIQSDSKPNSFDLDSSAVSYPESATTRTRIGPCYEGQADEDNQSRPQQLQRSTSQIKRSLDSVMLRPSSTLSSSTLSEATRQSPSKLMVPDESNIHPLFRSGTRSPPPTATPSTMVVAAPDAGQTITVKTLQRMRSTRSFGTYASRRKSPLLEQTDHLFEDAEHRAGSISSYANSEHT